MVRQPPDGPGPVDPTEPNAADEPPAPRVPITQHLGRAVLVALAVLVIVFALANSHRVTFSWVFGRTVAVEVAGEHVSGGVPLIALLLVSFAVGALVGALSEWQFLRRQYQRGRR